MTPLSFTATVLGLYGAYYGTLYLVDGLARRNRRTEGAVEYTLTPSGTTPASPTESVKQDLLPDRYLPPDPPREDPAEDDTGLGIEYLTDDGIEATDDHLAALLRNPDRP
jgi:hypothetical protein